MDMVMCEQNCGDHAVAYAGEKNPNGWAGYFCADCVVSLGLSVWDKFPNGIIKNGFLRKEGK
jgi:hypothetical protein